MVFNGTENGRPLKCLPIAHQNFHSPWATAKRIPWYSTSHILISFYNSSVIHGFLFLYQIFSFLMENLYENIVE